MVARIYKPAKTAMQSGEGRTKEWVLEFAPASPREIEPLMGWTGTRDMRAEVQLAFDSKEEAVEAGVGVRQVALDVRQLRRHREFLRVRAEEEEGFSLHLDGVVSPGHVLGGLRKVQCEFPKRGAFPRQWA